MKVRLTLLTLSFCLLAGLNNQVFAINSANPAIEKTFGVEFENPISVNDLLTLKVKDIEAKSGQKFKLKDKISMKVAKMYAKRLERKGNNKKAIAEGLAFGDDFNVGGFVMGLLLSLLGVILVYIFFKDQTARKWAWYGLLASIVLYLLFGIII